MLASGWAYLQKSPLDLSKDLLLQLTVPLLLDPIQSDGLAAERRIGSDDGSIVPCGGRTICSAQRSIDFLDILVDNYLDQIPSVIWNDLDPGGSSHCLQGALQSLKSHHRVSPPWFKIAGADLRKRLQLPFQPLFPGLHGTGFAIDLKVVVHGIDYLIPNEIGWMVRNLKWVRDPAILGECSRCRQLLPSRNFPVTSPLKGDQKDHPEPQKAHSRKPMKQRFFGIGQKLTLQTAPVHRSEPFLRREW